MLINTWQIVHFALKRGYYHRLMLRINLKVKTPFGAKMINLPRIYQHFGKTGSLPNIQHFGV